MARDEKAGGQQTAVSIIKEDQEAGVALILRRELMGSQEVLEVTEWVPIEMVDSLILDSSKKKRLGEGSQQENEPTTSEAKESNPPQSSPPESKGEKQADSSRSAGNQQEQVKAASATVTAPRENGKEAGREGGGRQGGGGLEEGEDEEGGEAEAEEEEGAAAAQQKLKKNRKKRAKKNRKKKEKQQEQQQRERKTVSWGVAQVARFPRVLAAESAVPARGAWPLGLAPALPPGQRGDPLEDGAPAMAEVGAPVPLDGYEAARAARLAARAQGLSKRLRKLLHGSLETRQFDYKLNVKNPLFGVVDEAGRRRLLLGEAPDEDEEDRQSQDSGGGGGGGVEEARRAAAAARQRQRQRAGGRRRSNRSSASARKSSVLEEAWSRGASSVLDDDDQEDPVAAALEQMNATTKIELRELRVSRDNTGCECAKIKNADKLHPNTLRATLEAIGCEFNGDASKQELSTLLKEQIEGKGICELLNCSCHRSGVQCHADVCGCCFTMQMGKKIAVNGQKRCGNPRGLYAYSSDRVGRYRAPFVTARDAHTHHAAS